MRTVPVILPFSARDFLLLLSIYAKARVPVSKYRFRAASADTALFLTLTFSIMSNFFDLPVEIRFMIYGHVVRDAKLKFLPSSPITVPSAQRSNMPTCTALLT